MDLCKTPELAAQVAFGPVEDFDFDLAILFSDLLFPLEALGMGLAYTDHGPQLGFSLREENIHRLVSVEEALPHLEFQKEAMSLTREGLSKEKSLIGFVGGPWTLFVYACEGSHAGALTYSMVHPHLYQEFSKKMVPLLEKNIRLQFEGGAEVVMVLDTACGEVSPSFFKNNLENDLISLAQKFPHRLGYYSKGSNLDFFTSAAWKNSAWGGQGYDHRISLQRVLSLKDRKGLVQGNFDQRLLFADTPLFEKYLHEYLSPIKELSLEERSGWVCGVGHGVLPKTPEENVRKFVETVREVFR
jgi:uroporphyrinogen decarboxylase